MKQRMIIFLLLSVSLFPLKMSGQFTVYLNTSENELLRLDDAMCNPTLVTELIAEDSFLYNQPYDIAFTPNGKLYGIISNSIVCIDTLTGVMETVCFSEVIDYKVARSLESVNDSILLFDMNDSLWSINIRSCISRNLGEIGYREYPYYDLDGDLLGILEIMFSDGDLVRIGNDIYVISVTRLYKIELDEELNILNSSKVNGDDIELPGASFGLAYKLDTTSGIDSPEYKILSFHSLSNIYSIDPETAYFDTFCISSGYLRTNGAAYLPLVPANDTNTTDTGSTSIHHYDIENNIQIFPNPSDQGTFYIKSENSGLNDWNIELYDILGRKVGKNLKVEAHQIQVLLENKGIRGLVILEIRYKDQAYRKKVLLK